MELKVFTLAFSRECKGFDTSELDDFVRKNEVCGLVEHFFTCDGHPYWAMVVSYRQRSLASKGNDSEVNLQKITKGKRYEPQLAELDESQQKLYRMLKKWRIEKAGKNHCPAYYIFHDRQLLDIVRTLPDSITALTRIRGIGASKSEQYGPQIIEEIEKWKNESHLPTT